MCGSTGVMVSNDMVILPAQQVGGHGAAAFVGHVRQLHPGHGFKLRADQVLTRAIAVGTR